MLNETKINFNKAKMVDAPGYRYHKQNNVVILQWNDQNVRVCCSILRNLDVNLICQQTTQIISSIVSTCQ
jgi:hypothetical protein